MTDTRVRTEKFTRHDYMRTPEGFPAELIDGEFVKRVTPPPWHQHLVVETSMRLLAVAGRRHAIPGPADVFVDDWNVLQPDALVTAADDPIGPHSQATRTPVLVVEILSPATARRDREVKPALYLRAGVREVWLVDPDGGTIEVHTATGAARFAAAERAASTALPGFSLAWRDLAPPRA